MAQILKFIYPTGKIFIVFCSDKERLTLLELYFKWAPRLYDEVLSQYSRKELSLDDIVDAMVCLYIAHAPKDERKTFPNSVIHDDKGIKMAMHMFLSSISKI